jgi:predicted membrane protein
MAGAGLGRGLATPLLVLNFCLYLVAAILAGWALNRNFDASFGRGEGAVGNVVTQSFFLPITLIACMVGLASVLAGVHHMRMFRSDSLAAAAAASLIAWLLVLLAMGLACKQIHTGGNRPRRLKVVEAFIIILALFELLYLLSLHAGFGRMGHGGPGAGAGAGTSTGIGMGGHHGHSHGAHDSTLPVHNHGGHVDYGHHTDLKIPVGHVPNPAHPTATTTSTV